MHIGLIGGIGPAATDFYYRHLISAFSARAMPLDLTIVHADTATLLGNLARNDTAAQVAIYERLTNRLKTAGAECVVVTSIAGHFCIQPFKSVSPLPVVDMVTAVAEEIERLEISRIGILGTRTVMETRFYGAIPTAEIVPPDGQDLDDVHTAYVDMAKAGVATDAQRVVFDRAVQRLLSEQQVEAIMLGGTDLALIYHHQKSLFPLIDCAAIHVNAIVRLASAKD